ncbi:MAG: hypothetical protein Q4P05_05975 [Actinomycetaceae bacterium]|nr:hypothetical protein [Actinomycetaceae bacterium]
MEDSSCEFSQPEVDVLARELTDYAVFKSRVIIRDDVLRMGVLLCAVGAVAAVMNALVVAGDVGLSWGAIASGWFAAVGSGWLFTILFRILAVGALLGTLGGFAVLVYAPFHRNSMYRRTYAAFCDRGWIAHGCATGLTVDDDGLWIKREVEVVVWSADRKYPDNHWRRDCAQIKRDFTHSDRKMMASVLLADRKFHGLMTIGQLRSQFDRTGKSRRSSYIGFGPLHRMRAHPDLAVVAPPSTKAIRSPQAFEDLLFWIRR